MSQKEIVKALMKKEAYNEDPGKIEFKQTHISYIFLTKNFVYKIKKAVNFGFLDFLNLDNRRIFCKKELELNKRLCKDMYIDVVSINKSSDKFRINGKGEPVEYSVKMNRIPEEKIMTRLLEKNKINHSIINKIAKIISNFHLKAKNDKKIDKFGSSNTIMKNWTENFDQTKEFINITISKSKYHLIFKKVTDFLKKNDLLLKKRVKEKRIRDCHGDIHSGNIFIHDKIYIFDAIEFNERFRYSDYAADIAFLVMDLEFKKHTGLANFFVQKYIEYSLDKELKKVLPFYKCYRAYIRGKVISFKLNDDNISNEEKNEAKKEAKSYFNLAAEYTKSFNKKYLEKNFSYLKSRRHKLKSDSIMN